MPADRKSRNVVTIVDENVILRYLLNDDASKANRARRLILGGNVRTYPEVIVRVVCVLSEVYGVPRSLIGNVIELLMGDIQVEEAASVRLAARLYSANKLDFDDCLMAARSALHGYRVEKM